VLWVVFHRRAPLVATIIAGLSWSLGGFVALFQKISTTEHGRSRSLTRAAPFPAGGLSSAGEILFNPFALGWIALSVVSMLVIQFAYRRGRAIRIIPSFSANYIVVPILGGMLVFGESRHALQWFGVLSIIAGALVLTLRPADGPVPPA
jgi:drug/metabolite transporter (DMT)-like permease